MHIQAVGADAGLSRIQELDQLRTLGGVNRVSVLEHHKGCVSAQFAGYPLHIGSGLARQQLADGG